MKSWTRRALLAFSGGLFVSSPGAAQNVPFNPEIPDDEEETVIKGGVELVNVMATVRDKTTNALAKGLKISDFRVFEDGKEQPIRNVSIETDLPLMLGMLIDVSGSMDIYIPEEREAGSLFFREVLRPQDRAFVADFSGDIEMLQDVTSEPQELEEGLEGLLDEKPHFGTALYDAVYLSCQQRLNGQNERKVLIVLSDGADYGSRKSLADAIKIAQRTETIVYAIAYPYAANGGFGGGGGFGGRGGRGRGGGGFGGPGGGFGGPGGGLGGGMGLDSKDAEKIMKKLAEETGGRLFTKPTAARLSDIYKEIQDEVRSQYSISYSPPSAAKRDGKFRKIEVRAVSNQYKLSARKGYYAAAPPK